MYALFFKSIIKFIIYNEMSLCISARDRTINTTCYINSNAIEKCVYPLYLILS